MLFTVTEAENTASHWVTLRHAALADEAIEFGEIWCCFVSALTRNFTAIKPSYIKIRKSLPYMSRAPLCNQLENLTTSGSRRTIPLRSVKPVVLKRRSADPLESAKSWLSSQVRQ